MFNKKLTAGLMISMLMFFVVILTSCGSGGGNAESQGEEPKRSDLNIRITDSFSTLDPQYWGLLTEFKLISQIYEPLFRLDSQQNEVPVLASGYELADDGLSIRFTLKDGVYFSNGEELSASDVKYSIERTTGSPYLSGNVSTIASVDADDELNTVTIYLSAPTPAIVENISWIYIVNEDFVEANKDENGLLGFNVCGTGPYTLGDYTLDSSISLTANPEYRDGAAPIQTLNYFIIQDNSTASNAIQSGELDLAQISPSNIALLKANDGLNTQSIATTHITYLIFNTQQAPFDDALVRQAIASAINREDIIALDIEGMAKLTYTFASPLMVGYADIDPQFPYDPERAKELLAQAGYADGLDLGEVKTIAGTGLMEIVQQQLAQVGISMTIQGEEVNALLSDLMTGNFGMSNMGMTNTYDMSWLANFYHSKNIGFYNLAQYSNDQVDELLTQAATEMDGQKRQALYQEFLEIADTDTPYVSLYNKYSSYAWNSNLNYTPDAKYVLYYDVSWK